MVESNQPIQYHEQSHNLNCQAIFFDGNESNFDVDAVYQIELIFYQNNFINEGDKNNDQPNNNGVNTMLKTIYKKIHDNTKFTPSHTNTIFSKMCNNFKSDSGREIIYIFSKKPSCHWILQNQYKVHAFWCRLKYPPSHEETHCEY